MALKLQTIFDTPANQRMSAQEYIDSPDSERISDPTNDNILRSQMLDGYWLRLDWPFPPEGAMHPGELEIAKEQGLF